MSEPFFEDETKKLTHNYSCDDVLLHPFGDGMGQKMDLTCAVLENEFGCDCTGCTCEEEEEITNTNAPSGAPAVTPTPATPPTPPAVVATVMFEAGIKFEGVTAAALPTDADEKLVFLNVLEKSIELTISDYEATVTILSIGEETFSSAGHRQLTGDDIVFTVNYEVECGDMDCDVDAVAVAAAAEITQEIEESAEAGCQGESCFAATVASALESEGGSALSAETFQILENSKPLSNSFTTSQPEVVSVTKAEIDENEGSGNERMGRGDHEKYPHLFALIAFSGLVVVCTIAILMCGGKGTSRGGRRRTEKKDFEVRERSEQAL